MLEYPPPRARRGQHCPPSHLFCGGMPRRPLGGSPRHQNPDNAHPGVPGWWSVMGQPCVRGHRHWAVLGATASKPRARWHLQTRLSAPSASCGLVRSRHPGRVAPALHVALSQLERSLRCPGSGVWPASPRMPGILGPPDGYF